ncbi:MAG: DNA methyltransferase [Candidatus Omnitrophota bacterium]
MRVEHIGDATLYCGDAFDILPTLGHIDAVITDPPYGIEWNAQKSNLPNSQVFDNIRNDAGGLDIRSILSMQCLVIAFGANCYPWQLPSRGRWICWDKRVNENADRMLGSPFELAWTNKDHGFDRMYRVMHGGVVNADGRKEVRVHPTQKPVRLFKRILQDYTKAGDIILDPFLGSGTTGIACAEMGRKFIGIEIDEGYFDIACKRIRDAYKQPELIEANA